MAWTTEHLATIEAAIAKETLRCQFGERMVEYRTITELLKARDAIKQAIRAAGGSTTRCTYATHSKG
jgi:hypothetical protein